MRTLLVCALLAACLAVAATTIQGATNDGQPIPKIYGADDGTPAQSPAAGATASAASAALARGHGKINSPAGALTASPQANGKADVQFDYRQAAGASFPDGSARFRLKTAAFDF